MNVKPFQTPAPKPAALDVPLPTLRERMQQLVARQRVDNAAERLRLILAHPETAARRATAGELAEYRHLLYDADTDAATKPFPYPTAPKETS